MIQQILLPSNTSADHLVAAFLLKEYGEKQYPGVGSAELVFVATATPAEVLELNAIGSSEPVAAGPTDTISAALGLSRLPELQTLLKWIRNWQKNTEHPGPFELGRLVPSVVQSGDPSQLDPLVSVLQLHINEQKKIYYELPEEWSALVKGEGPSDLYDIKQGGRNIVLAAAQSDNAALAGYLFQNKKTKADIVIQEFADGRIDITTNPNSSLDLTELAKVVRLEEARVVGRDYRYTVRILFALPGFAEDSPEWYYDERRQSLLNHSGPAAKAPASALTIDDLLSAAFVALSSDIWEKDCPPTDCRGRACYFYDYGMPRCRGREVAAVPDMLAAKFQQKLSGKRQNRGRQSGRSGSQPAQKSSKKTNKKPV